MGDKSPIEWTDATKRCSRCSETKRRTRFAADRSRPDGLTYWCADCRNARSRAAYAPKGRPTRRGWLAPTRDGDKLQARRRINYLVERGDLPRPEDEPCFDCADELLSDGGRHEYDHYLGYSAAHQLDVEPVCQRCHRAREEARRAG